MPRALALLVVLSLTGCCFGGSGESGDDEDWLGEPSGEVSVPEDDLFVYAYATRTAMDPPARLRGRIPTTVASFRAWPDDAAPYDQVQARLAAGDPSALALWLDAATTAARSAPVIDVAGAYADILRFRGARIAGELRRRARTTPTPGAHETLMLALAFEAARVDEALFTAPDAPPTATLVWFGGRPIHVLTDAEVARVLAALEAHLSAFTPTDDVIAPCGEGVADAVDALEQAHQVDALLALAGRLTGAHADCFDLELGAVADPRAQERFRSACPRIRDAAYCAQHRPFEPEPEAETEPSILDEVQAFDFDPASVPTSGQRHDAILAALAQCATGDDFVAVDCLADLATLDRARAVEVARAWLAAHPDLASAHQVARALDAFPEPGSVVAYLRQHQLLSDDDDGSALGSAITPIEVLEALGHASSFDTETDRYPNEHDTLLIQLSGIAPATLHGVLFEEVAQEGSEEDYGERLEGDGPVVSYLLHAYDDGTRYEVFAENYGDWYDVDAVVGMLDTLAYVRRADVRWLSLDAGGQIATVVAGPEAGLRALVSDGWLVPAPRQGEGDEDTPP